MSLSMENLPSKIDDANFLSKKKVAIDLTTRCNLKCPYCFCYKVKKENELKFNEIINLLKDFYEMGIDSVAFSGGEPTIREDFIQIAETIGKWGMHFSLQTNGCLLGEQEIERIAPYLSNAGVSIDGPPHIHNVLRSGFDKSIETIEYLREFGIPTTINSSVVLLNWDHLDYLVDLALEKEVDELKMHPVLRMEYNRDISDEYFLPPDRFESFYSWLIDQSVKTMGRCRLITSLIPRKRILEHPCEASACWGHQCHSRLQIPPEIIIVQANGDVMPNEVVPDKFKMGSIRENPISVIMEEYFGSPRHEDYLRLHKYCYETHIQNSHQTIIDWKQLLVDESRNNGYTKYEEKNPIRGSPSAIPQEIDLESVKPSLDPRVCFNKDEQVIISPHGVTLKINEMTRKVILHCDGESTLDDITYRLKNDKEISWNVERRHVGDVVRFLYRMNIVHTKGGERN
ncbi:MAG: radical SAM protein [Theionarchaea archaeon]|nr:radical SAM protein [Theionarchaea archaeon]